ncbi:MULTISPECIES: hypothetical protein [unclassified Okeania]|uniref:hypothetical protein n=1 Tax=unclassified Okeania TaxID=2634635 RepID=UPI0013BB7797|nr:MULTISPECIES: hypothetical protein [unclassified Okeania]NET14070.1 hypothetical protein [Okeania sp. SIO1H6]NES76861.1 hypothetical protein [Okeania sp. SIO1H4]NET20490.1 hypothetical protein [Okeania sp. SIO1H5]NET78263.1 hypothetical protein [Okeania sp. SIO1F9]NET95556.1 hypothetical protein [Okeania sp. SIO1H2]
MDYDEYQYLGFALKSILVGGGDRRQETTHPSPLPGGEDRRNGNYRGSSRKNCKSDFSAIIVPKY